MATTVTAIRDYKTTFNAVASNQRRDIEAMLLLVGKFKTPLLQKLFFSDRNSAPVVSPTGKFEWYTKRFNPHNIPLLAEVAGGTSAVLTSGTEVAAALVQAVKVGDLLLAEGIMDELIVSAADATTFTVTHVDGASAFATIPAGTILKKIGSSYSEKPASAETISSIFNNEVPNENYLTIMKESFSYTGRENAGQHYTSGLTSAELFKNFLEEVKLMVERNFMLATAYGRLTGTKRTYGKGANGFIGTNVAEYTGKLTKARLDAYLDLLADEGSFDVDHYCGGGQFGDFQDIVWDKAGIRSEMTINEFGIRCMTYHHPRVTVRFIQDHVMDGVFYNYGFSISNDALVKGRHMIDEPEKGTRKYRITDATPIGQDETVKLLMMDIGFQIGAETLCGKLYRTN